MDVEPVSKGEQTRLQIIQAAHKLFISQGFHATSMREIARQAGITLSGIYNHFDTKEHLFEAVYFTNHPYTQLIPAVLEAQGNTTQEILRETAKSLIASFNNQPEFLNLMFIDLVEFQNKYTSKLLEQQFSSFSQIYQHVFLDKTPPLRPLPPLIIVRSFFGLFFSYYLTHLILSTTPKLPPEIDLNAFEAFLEIYLHGILSENRA
jgi:AcrR family transcriptional regulator